MAGITALSARSGRPDINADLQDLVHQIHEEFDDRLDPSRIDTCLDAVAAQFADAKIRTFVPLLVRRYVRDQLLESLASDVA